ncbi:hypothetical protein E2C01_096817 [Portunus trituberculatus]|uniref:Uncharacterized protein n=1 Tax=Portunus trituberculatus TaxID=210409 RepID=A0A5B7K434_PORTR|nr:hypothetical protein [Portunus trituberculatus]
MPSPPLSNPMAVQSSNQTTSEEENGGKGGGEEAGHGRLETLPSPSTRGASMAAGEWERGARKGDKDTTVGPSPLCTRPPGRARHKQ